MEKRNLTVDVMKGIGILLVIYGHTIILNDFDLSYYCYNFVFSFHMPLFFFLSGCCYSEKLANRTFADYFCSRFIKLIIPSWIYINLLELMRDGWTQYSTNIRMDLLYYVIPEGEWFLPTIFMAGLLLLAMVKIRVRIKKQEQKILLSVLFFCMAIWQGILIPRTGEAWYEPVHAFVFFRLEHVLVALSFSLLGFTANNDLRSQIYGFHINGKNGLVLLLLGIAAIRFTRITGYINLGGFSYGRSISCFYLNAIYWIGILAIISSFISKKHMIITSFFVFFGRRSLWVYLLQGLLLEAKLLMIRSDFKWFGRETFQSVVANSHLKPSAQSIVDFLILTALCALILMTGSILVKKGKSLAVFKRKMVD